MLCALDLIFQEWIVDFLFLRLLCHYDIGTFIDATEVLLRFFLHGMEWLGNILFRFIIYLSIGVSLLCEIWFRRLQELVRFDLDIAKIIKVIITIIKIISRVLVIFWFCLGFPSNPLLCFYIFIGRRFKWFLHLYKWTWRSFCAFLLWLLYFLLFWKRSLFVFRSEFSIFHFEWFLTFIYKVTPEN